MIKTRGMRNNNPLYIRKSKGSIIGKAALQQDSTLVTFKSMSYGYRMAWKTLESIRLKLSAKNFRFNVSNVIYAWFPQYEGYDTESIIRDVCKMAELGRLETLPLPEQTDAKSCRMLRALTAVLNSIEYDEVDVAAIEEGYELSLQK